MGTVEYTYWRDNDTFLGFLNDHPDYSRHTEINERLAQHIIKKLRGD